jgi:D-arabinono-1,4-lactone oxidase
VINPYPDNNNNNLCLVITRAEAPITGPVQRPRGDVEAAVNDMVNSLDHDDWVKLWTAGVFNVDGLSQGQKIAQIVDGILTLTPDQRHIMVEHYGKIMLAVWPTGTFRGSSYSVMDGTYGQAVGSREPSYSIELFLPAIDENGKLGFVDFVNAAIATINAATGTFLTGYVSLRFTGSTRAYLGMQQWIRTCAVEISVFQGQFTQSRLTQGEYALLTNILDMAYQYGGIPHWGQLVDLNVQGHGSLYPRYTQWRQVYARMSNSFTARTFENALSSRWLLTSP